jgi:hypothetical protein
MAPDQVQIFGDRLHVRVETQAEFEPVLHALAAAGLPVASWRAIRPTLEDVFIDRLAGASGRAAGQPAEES